MELKFLTPMKLLLPTDDESVKRFLTYVDKSVGYQISKLKRNAKFHHYDTEYVTRRLEVLKEEQKKCLVFYDKDLNPWTYSGLWHELQERFKWNIQFPNYESLEGVIPWIKEPPEMRYYQKEAFENLVKAGHGAIELPTGSGKTLVSFNLMKKYPVKTLLITPSTNIARQTYQQAIEFFGSKYVGLYGDGSKKYNKLFTIATGQAITRIEPGSKEWQELSTCKMFLADESHVIPAETFEKVCMGIAENAPLKFFISATQTRADGSTMKLTGLTGPIVYSKSYKELAAEGYLKEIIVKIFKVPTCGPGRLDPKDETREQLYKNPHVLKLSANIAEKCVTIAKRQVVIMIEEYEQFLLLKNFLKIPYEFVHGATSQEIKEKLPEKYWKQDNEQIFNDFNNGKIQCLIGTSSVGVGVDLKPVGALIYLQGGVSEVKVKQAIGRGTRPVAHKDLWVVDFKIIGSNTLERHLEQRRELYEEVSDNISYF